MPAVRVGAVAACLLGSGLCALVYQTMWLRAFRLVFGASTAATAAVLAVFMAGVGLGALRLARRVERDQNPLRLYAFLELGIAGFAAATPWLVDLVRSAYVALGGTPALGTAGGSALRLGLAALVLGVPTFLMGGTLPAAARAVEHAADAGRGRTALLYGANALGAVAGALVGTFILFEALGDRMSLWGAGALNLGVALVALRLAAGRGASEAAEPVEEPEPVARPTPRFVLVAAAGSGFAFFLLELVWYRMLGPLLGGSTYTFGLILAVALFGMALGSLAYSALCAGRPATPGAFALVCAVEALCVAVPFALGDRLMVLAAELQPFGSTSFLARVLQWTIMTAIVVGPASVAAGVQFPLLVALLGSGRENVAADTGRAYAWNTAGAIAGSLAGGFGLLPALGAPGAWQAVVLALVALSAVAAALALRGGSALRFVVPAAAAGVLALLCLVAQGPTAAWRHSPVGGGRLSIAGASPNELLAYQSLRRRHLVWEADGVESCIGLCDDGDYAFVVNGKADGSARGDAATQVMAGLLAALCQEAPRSVFVVGLGTGSTAGWLAAVPSVERVDVAELEPVVADVARACAPVNRSAMTNPKVRVWYGDAREAVLVGDATYELVVSEPSNPYRAGIASLFTREFYAAVNARLAPRGVFAQWLQGYDIDAASVRAVYATLSSVFPCVESWQPGSSDLLFLASHEPIVHDVAELRERLRQEPFRSALASVWRVTDLEGVFGHYVGGRGLAATAAQHAPGIVTDDRNLLEYALARTIGRPCDFEIGALARAAQRLGLDRPETRNGELDWEAVADRRVTGLAADGQLELHPCTNDEGHRTRTAAKSAYAKRDFTAAKELWFRQPKEPGDLYELLLVAQSCAAAGDSRTARYAKDLHAWFPAEADAVMAQCLAARRGYAPALALAKRALVAFRDDPWPDAAPMTAALEAATNAAMHGGLPLTAASDLLDLLRVPFAVGLLDDERTNMRLALAVHLDKARGTHLARGIVAELEPHVPWSRELLQLRADAYRAAGDARAAAAAADLAAFDAAERRASAAAIVPSPAPPR